MSGYFWHVLLVSGNQWSTNKVKFHCYCAWHIGYRNIFFNCNHILLPASMDEGKYHSMSAAQHKYQWLNEKKNLITIAKIRNLSDILLWHILQKVIHGLEILFAFIADIKLTWSTQMLHETSISTSKSTEHLRTMLYWSCPPNSGKRDISKETLV